MTFFLVALMFLMKDQLILFFIFFNISLSLKGAPLLWLPGILLVLAKKRGIFTPLFFLIFTVAVQIAIGYPFLRDHRDTYIAHAYGVGRRTPQYTALLWTLVPEDFFW